ncbi:hypothetical protein XELAEV_18029281mg [Xenopus laevis]|uniref:Uncharacterized protein n=1 Tax=Xenopus laevis TaxID=8355 RepID=A0A974CRE2_XENLA|nr:hypothetical protein XELAEV_18029281mg [Xenopus laevis]
MGMSASSRLYYQWHYEKVKHSRWISPDLDIFEIRDFEDPLPGPRKLHLKNEFWLDYRYIKAHLKHLYKDLEKINKAILIKNNERYSGAVYNPSFSFAHLVNHLILLNHLIRV